MTSITIVYCDSKLYAGLASPCELHYNHAWIQEFLSYGPRSNGQKTAWTTFFLVLNLFYSLQRGSNGFNAEKKTILFQGSRGGPTISIVQLFPGGGGGGPYANFYRNPYNLCFSRGGGPDPLPPPPPSLDPHMVMKG